MSYSDDMGAHWVKGNGGKALDLTNNQTSLTLGHVEDKEWIAVDHISGNVNQDHVYAMWTTFNGASGGSKIMVAVSRDRGQTFSKAVQLTTPSATTPANTFVYPSVGSDGTVYVAFVSGFDTTNKNRVGHVHVTKSVDDGATWTRSQLRGPRSRTRTATSRRRTSGTGSSRTSPSARVIRGMST